MTRNKRTKLLLLALLTMYVNPSLALDKDRFQPYDIIAEHATHDSQKNTTTFTGNVVITQGTTTLTGEIVTIIHPHNSNAIKKIIATGKPAVYSTKPGLNKDKVYASANKIEYFPNNHQALLTHNAQVLQGQNTLRGEKILYDTQTKTVISRSPGARNELIIQPHQGNSQGSGQ